MPSNINLSADPDVNDYLMYIFRKADKSLSEEQTRTMARFATDTMAMAERRRLLSVLPSWRNFGRQPELEEGEKPVIRDIMSIARYAVENEVHIIPIGEARFVLTASDARNLTPDHYQMMLTLARQDIHNPIYAELDENGELVIDE